jgi:hypothetical protein
MESRFCYLITETAGPNQLEPAEGCAATATRATQSHLEPKKRKSLTRD